VVYFFSSSISGSVRHKVLQTAARIGIPHHQVTLDFLAA